MFVLRVNRCPICWRLLPALMAWLAQVCLPMAHASAMAASGAGAYLGCGANSPAFEQKLAALPAELRRVLAPQSGRKSGLKDCARWCTTHGGSAAAMPSAPVLVLVSVSGGDLAPPGSAAAEHPVEAPRSRGPPSFS